MRILVGEISSYKAIVIAKFLKQNYEYAELFTYDYRKFTAAVRTKYSLPGFHTVINHKSKTAYIDELSKLVRKRDIDFFFPVHSTNIEQILKHKERFGNALSYMGNYDIYEQLHKKDVLQKTAKHVGVDTPICYAKYENAEVPFVAKPVTGASSKGVRYFRDESQTDAFKNGRQYIFQEYIEGFGCGYSVYARAGEILTGYGHKRLAEFPISGGSSVFRTGFFIEEMREAAEKILKEVGWTGFAMFEFKYTDEGRLVLIEVNPRIWGSINQGLQNGINYFAPIFGNGKYRRTGSEINTYLSPQIYLVVLMYLLKGRTKPFKLFKNKRNKRPDTSLWNDSNGWLSVLLRSFF